MKLGKLKKWDVEKLRDAVANSTNYTQVCRYLGLSHISTNFKTIKKYIGAFNIDISHFDNSAVVAARRKTQEKHTLPNDVVFVENCPHANTVVRRKFMRMMQDKYRCAVCGNEGIHMGKKLRLEMDHINGVNNDNRIENLRLLCPNCHSQTETFGYSRKQTGPIC